MASSVAKNTRQSLHTKLSEYLGGPRKFLPTEFPTLRDCLQQCLDLQQDQILMHDKDPRNFKMQEIFSEVALEQLDKLFDIAFCTCRIVFCGEDDAPCKETCDAQAHCLCNCDLKLKLPKKELLWIKAQQEKEGRVSSMQEFSMDAEETSKLRRRSSVLMIQDRVFAVDTIMGVGAGSEQGSTAVRSFRVPETVNLDARDLKALIDWEAETITEPVFTANMTLAQLDVLKVAPLELPLYSVHTQSCERAVKSVTEAAESVYGWAKRDGFIRTQLRNRELMPSLKTKKDFLKVFQA